MFLKTEKQKRGLCLKICYSYRRASDGKPTTGTYKILGLYDDLKKEHEDPMAWGRALAEQHTREENEMKSVGILDMKHELPYAEDVKPEDKLRKNVGFAVFSRIYHELELDAFWKNRKWDAVKNRSRFPFDVEAMFRLQLYSRLILPSSRRQAWLNRGLFLEDYNFDLGDMYECLSFYNEYAKDFTQYMDRMITKKVGRDTFLMMYDVTNYYFETDENDEDELDCRGNVIKEGFRKKGKNKQERHLPQIQLGLLMDRNGIPISFDTFRGNMHDSKTLVPVMERVKHNHDREHVIVVADKGMMGGNNIRSIITKKQGYIISNSVRKADTKFKEWVKDLSTYTLYENEKTGEVEYMIKERLTPRYISVDVLDKETEESTGSKTKVKINERQVVIWSRKYAERERQKRDKVLEKSEALVNSTSEKAELLLFGARKYIKKTPRDSKGKVIIPADYVLEIDEDKIDEEEELDGFYCICTNVIGFDSNDDSFRDIDGESWSYFFNHSDQECFFRQKDGFFVVNQEGGLPSEKIVEMYRELWRIEESFRITKSDLNARPVHVSIEEHIKAHFLICFTALVLMRILQYRLGYEYSASTIQQELKKACGSNVSRNIFVFDYRSRILDTIANVSGLDFSKKYLTRGQMNSMVAATKKIF